MTRLFLQMGGAVLLPFVVGLSLAVISPQPARDAAPFSGTSSSHLEDFNEILRYPEQLTGPLTGGFGEATCHSCHFDYDLNQPEGSLELEGIDHAWLPGRRYTFTINVSRESLGRGGFQMSARFPDGSQAGRFEPKDERVTFTQNVPEGLQYIQHSAGGVEPVEKGLASWSFDWVAPQEGNETILLHIAANAANGDRSEFEDWIYLSEITLRRDE